MCQPAVTNNEILTSSRWKDRCNWSRGLFLSLLLLFLAPFPIYGEPVTIERQYTRKAGMEETKAVCRLLAFEEAKRLLLQDLAERLANDRDAQGMAISKGQVSTLALGLAPVAVTAERWQGKVCFLKVRTAPDRDTLLKSLDTLRKDVRNAKDLEWAREKTDELIANIARLRKEIESLKSAKTKPTAELVAKKTEEYQDLITKLGSMDWFEKGFQLQVKGDSQGAIKAYTRALKSVPGFIRALFNRGSLFAAAGSYDLAVKDFDVLLTLTSDSVDAHLVRGASHHRLANHRGAIADMDQVIAKNPECSEAHVVRGASYHKLGDYGPARNDFSKVVELNPRYAEGYNMLGSACFGLGDYRQAVDNHTKAIELNPEWPPFYFSRGSAYYRLDNFGDAIRDFDRAIELNPTYAEAYAIRGAAYGSMGEYERADADLETAARLGDKDAQGFLQRARTVRDGSE